MVTDLLTFRLPTRLLTLESMARARTHVSMCLWEACAPDLTHCVSYVFAPTPTPPPPGLTQSKLLTPLTAPTTPLSDTAQVANVIIITISYMLIKANTLAVLTSNPPLRQAKAKAKALQNHPKARGTRWRGTLNNIKCIIFSNILYMDNINYDSLIKKLKNNNNNMKQIKPARKWVSDPQRGIFPKS